MNIGDTCYRVTKGHKKVEEMTGIPATMVATIHKVYNNHHTDNPIEMFNDDAPNIQEIVRNLVQFRKELYEKDRQRIKEILEGKVKVAEELQILRKEFGPGGIKDVADLIAMRFISFVNKVENNLKKAGINVDRESLLNGTPIIVNGQEKRFNQDYFFSAVFNSILQEVGVLENPTYRSNMLKVINNWPASVVFAKYYLNKIENLPMNYSKNKTIELDVEDIEEFFSQEESTKEGWQEVKDRISSFGSLALQIKRVISCIQNVTGIDNSGNFIYEESPLFGTRRTVSPMEIHRAIQELTISARNAKEMISMLEKHSKYEGYYWLPQLIDILRKDKTLRSKFFSNICKDNQKYITVTRKFINGAMQFKTMILNRRDKGKGDFIAQMKAHKTTGGGNRIYDKSGKLSYNALEQLRKDIRELEDNNSNGKKLTFKEKYAIIENILSRLGITHKKDAVTKIIMSNSLYNKLLRELSKLGDPSITGTSNALSEKTVAKLLELNQNKKYVNAFTEHASNIGDFITAISNEGKYESSVLYIDKKGKKARLQSYVASSYLGDFVKEINANSDSSDNMQKFLFERYGNCPQFQYTDRMGNIKYYSRWLTDLRAAGKDSFAANIDWVKFPGESDTLFENIGPQDHMLDMMAMYFAEQEMSRNSSTKFRWYPIFILGDSNVSKFIKAPHYDIDTIVNEHYNLFLSEQERMTLSATFENTMGISVQNMKDVKVDPKTSEVVDFGTGSKFTILTYLNKDFKTDKGVATSKYYDIANRGNFTQSAINEATELYLKDCFEEFKQDLVSLEIVSQEFIEGKTKTIPSTLSQFVKTYNQGHKTENEDMAVLAVDNMLKDYFYNTKFATIQQVTMFTIDPGFYEHTNDLQKRYKELHASGNKLNNEDHLDQSVIYFDDISTNAVETNPEFMIAQIMHYGKVSQSEAKRLMTEDNATKEGSTELKRLLGNKYRIYSKYKRNTLTDGQAWRTLDSYKKIMDGYGRWSAQDENVYKEIKSITGKEQLSTQDIERLSYLASTFQPIKPYMFTIESVPLKNNLGEDVRMLIPVQHKYAEAILIPEILPKDSKLKALGEVMQEKGIEMAMSTKCVKVGGWGACNISNVSNKEELRAAVETAAVHKFSLDDYREQNSITDHTNQVRSMGTQARKLIMSNLKTHKDYNFYFDEFNNPPTDTTGKDVMTLYNSVIMAGIMDTFEDCVTELGNKKKLSKNLTDNVMTAARGSMDKIIAYTLTEKDGDFLLPLFEGTLKHDSLAMLLSIFKNRVNKQKILGGSAVQVSAMGITGFEESKNLKAVADPNNPSNILYAECEMPFNFEIERNGKKEALDYNNYCNPDGTLIPSKYTFGDKEFLIINGRKYLKREYLSFKNVAGEICIPKIEIAFPHILDRVAYRIPTERNYSMLNLKITRFSLSTAGGTIKVPSQYTTIAGFDFDIDKLYFLSYEYKITSSFLKNIKLSREQVSSVLSKIKENYPEFIRELPPITEESFSKSQLYDIFRQIYEDYPELGDQLSYIREGSGEYSLVKDHKGKVRKHYSYPLNHYFEMSSEAAKLARKEGYASIKELKSALVAEAANKLKYLPEIIVTKKGTALAFNEEAIANSETTKGKLFSNAANELGIPLREKINLEDDQLEYEEYDFSKSALENTKASRNNLIISLMRARLMDEDTFEERYTPGGFPIAGSAARLMREVQFNNELDAKSVTLDQIYKLVEEKEDPEPNYDFSNPMTIVRYNEQNQVAGKLIGIAANQNSNQALTSLISGMYITFPSGKNLRFGKMLTHSPHVEMKEGKGIIDGTAISTSAGYTLLAKTITYSDGTIVDIDLNMAELLAAAVDAVKDPVLNYLNINSSTANVACLLLRLGYSIEDVGLFLNQPIIKQLCNKAKLENNGYLDSTILELTETLKASIRNNTESSILSSEQLVKNIISFKGKTDVTAIADEKFKATQLEVLEMFSSYLKAATELNQYVSSSKFTAANSVGSTEGDLYAQQSNVEAFITRDKNTSMLHLQASADITDNISSDEHLLQLLEDGMYEEYMQEISSSPFAYEQLMYDCNRLILKKLDRYYPYEQKRFKDIRKRITNLSKSGKLKPATINMLHDDLITYLLNTKTGPNNRFNPASLIDRFRYKENNNGTKVSSKEYYTTHFAEELQEYLLQHPELNNSPLFKYVDFTSEEQSVMTEVMVEGSSEVKYQSIDKVVVKLNIENLTALGDVETDVIMNSWLDLDYSESAEHKRISEDLFFHGLFNGGLGFSPKTLMSVCPTEIKADMVIIEGSALDNIDSQTYSQVLRNILNGEEALSNIPYTFDIMFLLNNTNLWDFKYKIKRNQKTVGNLNMSITPKVGDVVTIPTDDSIYPIITYIGNDKHSYCTPLLEYSFNNKTYYLVADNGENFNKVPKNGKLQYVVMESLGAGATKNYAASMEDIIKSNIASVEESEIEENNNNPEDGDEVRRDTSDVAKAEEKLLEQLAESVYENIIGKIFSEDAAFAEEFSTNIEYWADRLSYYKASTELIVQAATNNWGESRIKSELKRMIKEGFKSLKETDTTEFNARIEELKILTKNNKVLMMDEFGNLKESC